MGGQEAFAIEATCTTWEATWLLLECASTQLDNSWQKHGQHMGSQKAFGSKLSFWPAGCWHLGMVKLSLGPPVWLAQVTLMASLVMTSWSKWGSALHVAIIPSILAQFCWL